MKISFVVLGNIEEVSGGHIYNREIANASENIQLRYQPDLASFKKCLNEPHDLLLIDGWGLHNVSLSDINQEYHLLAHHPIAMDPTITGDATKEENFWVNAKSIVVTGTAVAQYIQSKTETKLKIVEPGIVIRSDRAVSHQENKVPNLLGIGSFIPRKGDDFLLKVCSKVKLPFILNRIGPVVDQIYFDTLKKKISSENIQSKVNFEGEVSVERKLQVMNQADLAVFPTSYESYGMAIQECLVHGIPIVTNDLPGMKERFGNKGVCYVNSNVNSSSDSRIESWESQLCTLLAGGEEFKRLKNEAAENNFSYFLWEEQADMIEKFLFGC
jgi:glycosyltransferase involved in cell wall biosynthesis